MRTELLNARKEAKLTQEQVAVRVDIDRTLYNRIERGSIKKVDIDLAIKIAKVVNREAEDLFLPINVHIIHNNENGKEGCSDEADSSNNSVPCI